VLPELLQGLALALGTLGQSVGTWLGNVAECTLRYEVVARQCGGAVNSTKLDCVAVFSAVDARCHAVPNHLALDLLTPGLFARQAAQSLQGMIANSCGAVAIVLNLAMYRCATTTDRNSKISKPKFKDFRNCQWIPKQVDFENGGVLRHMG
jgi:hypothetical protein